MQRNTTTNALLIILILMIAGVFIYLIATRTTPVANTTEVQSTTYQNQPVVQNPVQTNTPALASIAYPLPTGVTWGEAVPKVFDLYNNAHIVGNEVVSDPQTTDETGIIPQQNFNMLESRLQQAGWVQYPAVAADGVNGSQMGYKKDNGVIILSWKRTPLVPQSQTEPGVTCPCTVELHIFTGTIQ